MMVLNEFEHASIITRERERERERERDRERERGGERERGERERAWGRDVHEKVRI